jgi:hypothetical protein
MLSAVVALTIVSAAVRTGIEADDCGEATAAFEGSRPVATAESLTEPLARSAAVTVYVPVQISLTPGASVVCGHTTADMSAGEEGATGVSVTPTPLTVTLPVFVTVNVNGICCPTADTVAVAVAFWTESPATGTVIVTDDGEEATGLFAESVPRATAVSVTCPLLRSARVTVYVPVHVVDWPGAREVSGQLIADMLAGSAGASCVSAIWRFEIVPVELLVTRKVYGMVWPAAVSVVVVEAFTIDSDPGALAGMASVLGADPIGVPSGSAAVATALSLILPLTRSAAVAV